MERKKGYSSMIWPILSCLLYLGCEEGFEQHPTGLKYRFEIRKHALSAQEGEYLLLDLRVKTADTDSSIFSTADLNTLYPYRHDSYRMEVGTDNPLDHGFHEMGLGDSVIFLLPAKDLAQSAFSASLDHLSPQRPVKVMAKAMSILPYEAYRSWQSRQIEQRSQQHLAAAAKQQESETRTIRNILESRGRPYTFTESGVGYFLENEGQGLPPRSGDTVQLHYSIQYTDGTPLPSEIGQSGPEGKSLRLGTRQVLPCWQEIISLLPAGTKGRFYFPSSCAFGNSGTYGIRPGAILVIDLELSSIKRATG